MDKIEPLFGNNDVELKPEPYANEAAVSVISGLDKIEQTPHQPSKTSTVTQNTILPEVTAAPKAPIVKKSLPVKPTSHQHVVKALENEAKKSLIALQTMRLNHTVFLTWMLALLTLTLYKLETKGLVLWLLMVGSLVCSFVAALMCVALDAKRRSKELTSIDWLALVLLAPVYIPLYLLFVYGGYRAIVLLSGLYGLMLVSVQFIDYVNQLPQSFWQPLWQLLRL